MIIDLREFINPVYGEQYPEKIVFQWSTDVVSYGLTEQRNQLWPRPKRHWYINWEALNDSERDKFIELFNRAAGKYRTFLLKDRRDYLCKFTDWSYTAAGGEITIQLQKKYYPAESETWTENKKDIVPGTIYAPTVKIDGIAKTEDTHFTLDDTTGVINWNGGSSPNGPLSTGQVVTADYQFYFCVRFNFDVNPDERYLPKYWRALGVHIVEFIR